MVTYLAMIAKGQRICLLPGRHILIIPKNGMVQNEPSRMFSGILYALSFIESLLKSSQLIPEILRKLRT